MGSTTFLIPILPILLLLATQQCESRQIHQRQSRQPSSVPMGCSQLANITEPILHLFDAAGDSNVSAVNCFIANGVNVSGQIPGGFTPLFAAAQHGNTEIVRNLIRAGAEVNAHDDIVGLTPLHAAVGKNFKEVATLLLDSGADINAKTNLGATSLQIAVTKDSSQMIELLLNKGADVNMKDNLGYTPLHIAANRGNLRVAEILVHKGADINAKTAFGKTPAQMATRHQNVFQFLISQAISYISTAKPRVYNLLNMLQMPEPTSTTITTTVAEVEYNND